MKEMTYRSNKGKKKPSIIITQDIKEKVLELFLYKKNNSVPEISKELDLTESVVHRVINNYFKENLKK